MRIATAVSVLALPLLVSGSSPVPGYGQRVARQAITFPKLSDLIPPRETTTTKGGGAPPPTKVTASSTTSKEPETTSAPLTTTSGGTSTSPTTSSQPPTTSQSTTSSTSSTPLTSETPTTTPETSTTPTTTQAESTSDAKPIVSVVTETVNGVATVVPAETSTIAKKEEGLSKGAIIGIAVGASVGGVAVLAALIFGLCRRTRRSSDDEAIRWPELNRHGDSSTVHALPAHRSDSGERRMSLGDELDGPQYLSDEHLPGATDQYDEKAYGYERSHSGYSGDGHHGTSAYTGEDYTSFPPPVQPQPSPVHGVDYDEYEWNPAYGDQYAPMQRDTSPPMVGGVAPGGPAFPQPHPTHNY